MRDILDVVVKPMYRRIIVLRESKTGAFPIVDVRRRRRRRRRAPNAKFFLSQTTAARNVNIYHEVTLDSLYISVGNIITSYFPTSDRRQVAFLCRQCAIFSAVMCIVITKGERQTDDDIKNRQKHKFQQAIY